jgi:hypothetical protein
MSCWQLYCCCWGSLLMLVLLLASLLVLLLGVFLLLLASVSVSAAANPTVANILEDCANCTPTSYSFPSCLNRTYLKVSVRIM